MRIYRIRKFPAKLFLLILAIVIIALNPKIFLGLKNFAFKILTRPFKALSGGKTYFTHIKDLSDENLLLKQRLAAVSVELARTNEVTSENERLRRVLNFKKTLRHKTIIAEVIARDSMDWRRSIIINKGRRHGLRERMPCATANGLVGSVAEVGPTSSKIMLITDPNSRVGVVLKPSGESGVLIGSPRGSCKVIYLPLDGKARKGDRVLTAGFSVFFPKGLAIGRVSEIGLEKTNLYKCAVVDPFEDMSKIEEVICIDVEK